MDSTSAPCRLCARPRGDASGLAWSSEHSAAGAVAWTCPACTRAGLWAIETLLDAGPVRAVRAA